MIQSVQLLFTRRRMIGSLLIRGVTWSAFSHVEIVVGDQVIGANMLGGVSLTPLKERLEKSSYAALVNIPCKDAQAIKQAALSMIGAGYDYLALFGLLMHSERFDSKARFFCSEFVAWAFEKAGSPLIRPEITGRVTPQHLWMIPAPTVTAGNPLSLLNLA
ncbi:YiiX/YebB-like N1pC/P60 family cysteine hydrolase [Pseudomonas sp. UMAB-40]|uniref:YiiX/YebB-like N1pC/P60 family cysteine hydrolase n=1 Tax=Pseudomonas sp. UMAB-40 TaxID=1365407 RepID=UPI001C592752|nr:YiiX/YebB-like N1pC/P60 family cysteine hydrolase [Pseudomonas sp. UMAB-40]